MTPRLYFVSAFAGVIGGIALLAFAYAAKLGLAWQAAGALLCGLGMASLTLGLRDLLNPAVAEPEQAAPEHDPAGPWTPEDFPCPDPTPGGTRHNGAYSGWLDPAPSGDEIAFAVVVPKRSSKESELKAIGERLLLWQSSNDFTSRVIGIDQLLRGEFPETPAELFWLPIPPLTEKVALVYVTPSANIEQTGVSLERALEGLSVAMVVSPAYYSQINR